MVANNATVLASALQAQGVASGVMQAGGMGMGGMGMLVNPVTHQPVHGLTMSGSPQMGWAPTGYSPGHSPVFPRFAAGMEETGETAAAHHQKETAPLPETRSTMPVPRFHPVPTQPAFQRSEGMAPTQRTITQTSAATTGQRGISERALSERELEAALDQAYLEGVAAAMDEVERKLEEKRQAVARARLEERILQQSENLQQQLDAQEELRILAIQREGQLQILRQQEALQRQASQQAETLAMTGAESTPARLPLPRQTAPQAVPNSSAHASSSQVRSSQLTPARSSPAQQNPAHFNPVQIAGNLKTSVVSGVNEIFAPLLGANHSGASQRGQTPAALQPRQNSPQPRAELSELLKPPEPIEPEQLAIIQPNLPVRPPVSHIAPRYGLRGDGEAESSIMQARFTDDGTPIRP